MKLHFPSAAVAILVLSCVSHPRSLPAPHAFHPDAARVRASFGIGADQIPDAARMDRIGRDIWELCKNAHPVRTPLDIVFDANRDGRLDQEELRASRSYFFGAGLLDVNTVDPDLARKIAAPPRVALSREDLGIWNDYLFAQPRIRLAPHAFGNDFERSLANGSRSFDQNVIRRALVLVSRAAAEAFLKTRPATVASLTATPSIARGPVRNQLQALANTSGSGTVSEQEARAAEEALKTPHKAATAFDHSIDFAGNGFIDAADIEDARRAAFIPATAALAAKRGPFPVVTGADALLDIDGDGRVTEEELEADARGLFQGGGSPPVPPRLLAAFDLDGDGKLNPNECQRALEFFRPHPVRPSFPLDASFDLRGKGFLSPEDIGIGAGQTAKGRSLSLDERLQALRLASRRQEAPTPVLSQRRIDLSGKKLAVVGLTSSVKSLDQETLDGTTNFLENAFVNVGSVAIVDRSDIDKVMGELELQSSDAFASNDSSAVKVGRLSGADIIVTGTISQVGKKYYLNLRLISIETADILGSSIASADSPDGFLEMCQQAAAKIF
jgi:hypothetical protein